MENTGTQKPKLGVPSTILSLIIGTALLTIVGDVFLWVVDQLSKVVATRHYAIVVISAIACGFLVLTGEAKK